MTTKKYRWRIVALLLVLAQPAWSETVYEVLKQPAVKSALATHSLLYSVARFGDRLFAVGHRGHILYSNDNGENWLQAKVPVRSDILDIYFPTPEKGWAVGHDGVILHSSDGGATWLKQFDGYRFGQEGLTYYQQLAQAHPDVELYQVLVAEMKFATEQGADKPLFKVWFKDAYLGYAFGAYGMFLVTQDGGITWRPTMHNVSNDMFLHLFDYTPIDSGSFLISGEAGLVLRGDVASDTAIPLTTPYEGSFFTGVTARNGAIIMCGLRGSAYRSLDGGETWTEVRKPNTTNIVDSTLLSDGRIVLVGQGGEVLISSDDGTSFTSVQVEQPRPLSGVVEGNAGELILVGATGVRKLPLSS